MPEVFFSLITYAILQKKQDMPRILLLLIMGITHMGCHTQDWPDWRGPNRDAIWDASGIVEEFDSDVIAEKWSVPVGPGYSGPTVSDGKVYVTDRLERPSQAERVLCFDEQSGKEIWVHQYACVYEGVGYPAGPRASVVIREGKAYSLGTMGHLFCFDAGTGKVLWQKNLNKEYEIDMPIWGIASTPLVLDDKIIVQVSASPGACVIAFNKDTGKELWRSLEDRAGYSAPILIEKDGVRVVVNWTEHSLSGLDPESGKVHWRIPWKTGSGMSIATPVLYRDHIFVSAFYSGSLLVKLGDDYTTAETVWLRSGESERKTDALHCVMNTPVLWMISSTGSIVTGNCAALNSSRAIAYGKT